ncbi:MAG: GDSL-type esterase/lipase family protein, partial [Solirubrobacterales bacterium]
MLAATASADLGRVVAVGDSLAAGTNLGPAVGTYPKCGQSSGSYMELAMARVKKSAWVNSVCNGGHSGVMDGGSWYGIGGSAANGDPLIPAQLDSLNGSEDVVIVGSGANEAFFGQITEICIGHQGYTLSDNACSMHFPAGLRSYTLNSEQRMAPIIDKIHQLSPNAKVILVGVPRITPADGVGCMPDPVLTLDDAPVWSVWEDTLRTSMIKVANEHNATFVDNAALSGPEHSMCAPPNMRWMNPWTVANVSWPGTPLHNTPWGADAMADNLVMAIKAAGRNTGTPNPPTLTRTSPTATSTQSTSQTLTYSGAAGHTFKCRLDNAAYTTCPSSPVTRTGLSAGPHSYSVIQTDASGNRSPAAILTWTIDTTAPTIPTVTRTSPVATPTNSTTQTITYAGAESGGTFNCKLDSASYAACPSSPAVLSGLADGSHTYSVTQTDAAGNVSPAASVTWSVNTVLPPAPNVARTSPSATVTNSTTQVITYSGNQVGGTFQCSLDSAQPTACPNSPVTLTGLGSGTHTFSVTQTDVLGNVGSAATVAWTVDLVSPATPTLARTSPTASPTNSATQTITFSGAEAGGTLQCKLDSAAYGACPASPVTLNGLSGGSHAYSVTQTDAAGNVGAVGTVSWTVDMTAPPIPIVSGPSGVSAMDSASITYSDSEAGVSFQCKLDSEPYAPCPANPVGLSGLAIGAHSYYVTATDSAGNTSGAGNASWTVDPSGFTVSIGASPSNPSTVMTASFSFAASVAAGTTYECKLDSAAFSSCSSAKSYNGLADGSHTFTVHGINGSLTTPDASRTWIVDTTPPGAPTLTRTTPAASPTNLTSQTFSLTAAEAGGVLSCKLDGGAVSTCPSSPITITGLGNGAHSFTATQTDAAGNTGSAATVTWTIDTSPPNAPAVARTSPTANPTNSTAQTLTYSGIEGSATAQCKLDTAAFGPCPTSPLTLTGLGEGSHTLLVTQTDAAGNVSTAGSVSWVVDSVPPSAPSVLRTSPTASPSNSTTQQISVAGTEAGTSLRCKFDSGSYAPCPSSPATYSGLTQGAHTLLVTQTDAAANVSAAASVTWTVDSIAPGAPEIGFSRPAVTNVNSATIGYTPAEPSGTFECSMDSAAWMPCPGNPVELILIPDGGHNYMVRQIDAAGNEGSVAQVAWVVDTVAPPKPTVALTSPTSSPTNQTTASLTITANENGGTLECKLDSAAYATCPSSPVSLTNLSFATHTYSVRQSDLAGNFSEVATATWVAEPDTTAPLAPTVTRTSPIANPTTSTSQTVSYSGAEAGGTLKCKLDVGAYSTCASSPTTLNGLANGLHTLSVTQTDSSGNVSPAGSVTWTVDNIAPGLPTVTRTSPTGNPTPSTSQTITYVGAEAGGTFQCKLDAASFAPCPASPVALSGLSDGAHSYSVAQTDAAGNAGSATTISWIIDISAPSQPTVNRASPTANPTNSTSQTITFSGELGGTFQCKLNTAAYVACPATPVTLTDLPDGTNTYSVKQTDPLGNVGQPTTITWTVDTAAPSAPIVARTSPIATPTNSTSQSVSYGGIEPGASAQCKLDSAAAGACTASPITLSGLSGGTHSFTVTQTDAAGNVSTAGAVSWVVDLIAPPTPNVNGPSGTSGLTTATVSYSNPESGVTFRCKLDAAAYAACPSSPVNLTNLSNGPHTYYVTATDDAGNVSTAGTASWTVDPSGFSVSITSAPDDPSTLATASFAYVST